MKPIEELTFTDDYMFGHVLRNPEQFRNQLTKTNSVLSVYVGYGQLIKR